MLTNQIQNEMFFKNFIETVYQIYQHGWAERNGGNISYLIDEEIINKYHNDQTTGRKIKLSIACPELNNKYFLVTGSGKFYRNIINKEKTKLNCGIVKIIDSGLNYEIVWGLEDNAIATSELPTHLQTHKIRLTKNSNHHLVIHSHLTHLIALTFVLPLDEIELTHRLWEMISECSVVFPDGLGMVPWMLPGGDEVGIATAEKMKTYQSVVWPQHGIFSSGDNFDNVLGTLEIIDKASYIYLNILQTNKPILNTITNKNFKELEKGFNLEYNKTVLNFEK